MMNYEIFKEVVAEKFKSYLPERYQNMELRVESVNKVNRVMDGITLIDHSAEKNISPTIYITTIFIQRTCRRYYRMPQKVWIRHF